VEQLAVSISEFGDSVLTKFKLGRRTQFFSVSVTCMDLRKIITDRNFVNKLTNYQCHSSSNPAFPAIFNAKRPNCSKTIFADKNLKTIQPPHEHKLCKL